MLPANVFPLRHLQLLPLFLSSFMYYSIPLVVHFTRVALSLTRVVLAAIHTLT